MKQNIFALSCINIIALSSISLFASDRKTKINRITLQKRCKNIMKTMENDRINSLHFLSELFATNNGPVIIDAREYARAHNEACRLEGTTLIFSDDVMQKYSASFFTNMLSKYHGGMPLHIADTKLKALPAPQSSHTKEPIVEDPTIKNLHLVMKLKRGNNT